MATTGRKNDPAFKRRMVQKVAQKAQAHGSAHHVESEAFHPEDLRHHHKVHLRRWQKPLGLKRNKLVDVVLFVMLAAGVAAFIAGLGGSNSEQNTPPTQTEQPAEDSEGEATATQKASPIAEETPAVNPASEQVKVANPAESIEVKAEIRRRKGDFIIPCWIVAYSANADKQTANINFSTLEALGYDAGQYFIPKYFKDGRQLHKVYVGPYKSLAEAEAILPKIQKLQPDAYVLKIDE